MNFSGNSKDSDMAVRVHSLIRKSSTFLSKLVVTCMLGTTFLTLGFADSVHVHAAEASAHTGELTTGAELSTASQVYSGSVQPEDKPLFSDLKDSYAQQEITMLVARGMISGYANGTFAPKKPVTRAELAKLLALSMGLQPDPAGAKAFKDVPQNSWYSGYIGALVKAGVTAGSSPTTFNPDRRVTREELVVFFIRGLGLEQLAVSKPMAKLPFTDAAQLSEWARPAIGLAYRIGLAGGMDNGDGTLRFEGKAYAERQALARMAYEFIINKADYLAKAEAIAGGGDPGGGAGNNAPVPKVVNPLNLTVGEASYGIMVQELAVDPDGDDLKLDIAMETTPGIIHTMISPQGRIDITPVAAGTTVLKVRIVDARGAHVVVELSVTVKAAGGAEEQITASPTVIGQVYSDDRPVIGTAEPNAQINIYTADRTLLHTGTAGTDGSYKIYMPDRIMLYEDQTLLITAQASNKTESLSAHVKVVSGIKTVPPSISYEFYEDGGYVKGSTTDSMWLVIQDSNHKLILEEYVGGSFLIPLLAESILSELKAGEQLSLRVKLRGQSPSDPLLTTIKPISGVTPDPSITGNVYDADFSLEVSTVPYSIIRLKREDGILFGGAILSDRSWTSFFLDGKELQAGQNLYITADALGQLESKPISKQVLHASAATSLSYVSGQVYEDGGKVLFQTQGAIAIRKQDGTSVFPVGQTDIFSGRVEIRFEPSQTVGDTYYVTARKAGYRESAPIVLTVAPLNGRTNAPVVTEAVYELNRYVSGKAEPGSWVTLTREGSSETLRYLSDSRTGAFSFDVSLFGMKAGDLLRITADQTGKAASEPLFIQVRPAQQTERPTVTGTVYSEGFTLHIKTEPFAEIQFVSSDGSVLFHDAADYYGNLYLDKSMSLPAGQELLITAAASGRIQSEAVSRPILLSPKTSVPSVTGAVYTDGVLLQGRTEANAEVIVSHPTTGKSLSVYASWDGYFQVKHTFGWEVNTGDRLEITAKLRKKAMSEAVIFSAQAVTISTAIPSVTAVVYEHSAEFTAVAEPGAKIWLKKENGELLAAREASDSGWVWISLPYFLAAGERVYLTADGIGKRESEPKVIIIQPSPQTAKPVVTQAVYSEHPFIMGQAEYGSKIVIKRADGQIVGTGTAYASFEVYLSYSFTPGEVLYVTAQAPNRKASEPIRVIVQTSPKTSTPSLIGEVHEHASTIMVLRNDTEFRFTNYTVTRANGQLIGQSINDGSKKVTLHLMTSLTIGEQLYVTAIAAGKYPSEPLMITVQASPVTMKPTVHGYVYEDGGVLTGETTPYAAVKLQRQNGEHVRSILADHNGEYVLDLSLTSFNLNELLRITAERGDGYKGSSAVELIVQPVNGTTDTPTVTEEVYQHSATLKGWAPPYSTVTIAKENGSSFSFKLTEVGNYRIVFPYDGWLLDTNSFSITADTYGKQPSKPLVVMVSKQRSTTPYVHSTSVYGSFYYVAVEVYEKAELTIWNNDRVVHQSHREKGIYYVTFQQSELVGSKIRLTTLAPGNTISDSVYAVFPVSGYLPGGGAVTGSVYGPTVSTTPSSGGGGSAAAAASLSYSSVPAVLPQTHAAVLPLRAWAA